MASSLGERLTRTRLAGVVAILAGVALVVAVQELSTDEWNDHL